MALDEQWHTRPINWLLKNQKLLSIVGLLVFGLVFSAFTIIKPIYEWDLIAYIANAMLIAQDQSMTELHHNVYSTVLQTVPADAYAWLIESPSRAVLSNDSEAFRQTITFFYDSRIVYNHLLAGLFTLGINPVIALYAFSTCCVLVSMLLLVKLLPNKTPTGIYIVVPFIVLALGLLTVARLATPDSLAALVTIALYYMLLRDKIRWLLFLFPLVIFIRTDLILLVGLFHLYFLVYRRTSATLIILSGLATVGSYFFINQVLVDADAWSSLIGYNYGEKPTHPEEYVFPVSMADYFNYLWLGVLTFTYNPLVFVFFFLVALGAILLSTSLFDEESGYTITSLHTNLLFVVASSLVYFLLHFLLFPVGWVRFFAAQYSIVAVVVCWCAFKPNFHTRQI